MGDFTIMKTALLKLYKRTDILDLINSLHNIGLDKILYHIDFSDKKTIRSIKNLLYKNTFLPFEVYISKTNLGCANAHKNALDWAFSLEGVNTLLIVEDDLKLVKAPNLVTQNITLLSEFYWSYLINKDTYINLKAINILDLPLEPIQRDLLLKMEDFNVPLIWDAELEIKLKYTTYRPIRDICFESIGVPSTRSNETPIYVTYKNGKPI